MHNIDSPTGSNGPNQTEWSSLQEDNGNTESEPQFKISETYINLAEQLLKNINDTQTLSQIGSLTFKELEEKTGIGSIIKSIVDQYEHRYRPYTSQQILDAIINQNPNQDSIEALQHLNDNPPYYSVWDDNRKYGPERQMLLFEELEKAHNKWIHSHSDLFIQSIPNSNRATEQDYQTCTQFLPFGRLGIEKMSTYANIAYSIFEGIKTDEEDLRRAYDNYVSGSGVYDDFWDDGSEPYEQPIVPRDVMTAFLEDARLFHDNPSVFYTDKLPSNIIDALRNNEKLARSMAYHYTLGKASYWDKEEIQDAMFQSSTNPSTHFSN